MASKVSTQTFVVYAQIENLDLKCIYDNLEPNETIVGLKYELQCKGTATKSAASSRNFLKCITFNIALPKKNLGAKLFRNGTVQITGCKTNLHATQCLDIIYTLIANQTGNDSITYYIMSVMLNVSFDCKYNINRESLGKYMFENQTDINVPPLTSGYMGLKVKLPYQNAQSQIQFPKIVWTNNTHTVVETTTYEKYFEKVAKKRCKRFLTSIAIFQNGKVLLSGVNTDAVAIAEKWVSQILSDARPFVEIVPKVVKTFKR